MEKITKLLFSYQDLPYLEFTKSLTPNINKEHFIGVRIPILRKIAKELDKEDVKVFLNELPHFYYEENLLHGFIIQNIKDYDQCLTKLNIFLPYVNCWAVSDTMCPKVFKKYPKEVIIEVKKWITSPKTYTIRFGLAVLMALYLDDNFKVEYLTLPLDIKNNDYYVKMMVAWFYQTSLSKRWDESIYILENKLLDKWTHNKTISKAIDSYRISSLKKEYLKTLRIK